VFISEALRIKIFADGADLAEMLKMNETSFISGLTTNPTLMRKAGITDYESFAKSALEKISEKPISFEVFSDDFDEMIQQARIISSWGPNVYVKVPITNTAGLSSASVVRALLSEGVKVNLTAIMSLKQIEGICEIIDGKNPMYISVFAGRIADTGRDPVPFISKALEMLSKFPKVELIWASPRELLNLFQANDVGCHIITATSDILQKLRLVGYPLEEFSLDTVKMFREDALNSGFSINT